MITLEQVKIYLWITDTSEDVKLQAILDWINQEVVSVILDYDFWEKEIYVKQKSIKYPFLPLRHVNPKQLLSVNWVSFGSQVEWQDYLILENWTAEVQNLRKICCASFSRFKVIYSAWWTNDEIPADLIALVAEMVWLLASAPQGNNAEEEKIKSETLWPRKVEYWVEYNNLTASEYQTALIERRKAFNKALKKYIPLHLRLW